jgi:hypothetical protein
VGSFPHHHNPFTNADNLSITFSPMTDLDGAIKRQTPSQEQATAGDGRGDETESSEQQTSPQKARFRATPWLIVVLCLGVPVGFGLGQAGHDFQVNQANRESDAAVQGNGDQARGPCKDWADTICERMGSEQAYECTHARAASRLLSGSACVRAQEGVLAKIGALKAGRVECDELFGKACIDLGPEGKGCEFATAKAPTFSSEECQDMKRHYKRVLAKLMKRQEEGTLKEPSREPGEDVTTSMPN